MAEARRAATLQEIERRHAALAQGLRRALAAEEVGDADARTVAEDAAPAPPDPGRTVPALGALKVHQSGA